MACEGDFLIVDSLASAEPCSAEQIQSGEGNLATDVQHCHSSLNGFENPADGDFLDILCLDESMLQLEDDILAIADDDIAGPINQLNLQAPATEDLRPLNEVPTPLLTWDSEESSLSEAATPPVVTERIQEPNTSSPETPCVKPSWPFQSPPPHKRFHSSIGSHREGSPVSVLTVRMSPGRPFEGLGEPALVEYATPNLSLRSADLCPTDSCALSSKSRSKRMRIMKRVWSTDVISHVVPEEAGMGSSDEFEDGYDGPMGEIDDGRIGGPSEERNLCTIPPVGPVKSNPPALEPLSRGFIGGPGPASSDISSLTLSGAELSRSGSTNQIDSLVKQPSKKRKPQGSPDGKDKDGIIRRCTHCSSTTTPQWRAGPLGPKTLCNACGVRFKSGRLCPEYRPANSPEFQPEKHSNSHRKIVEMRKQQEVVEGEGVSASFGNQQILVAPLTPSQTTKKPIKDAKADTTNVKPKREKTEEEKERARIRRRLRKQQQKLALQQQQQQQQGLQQEIAQGAPFFAGIPMQMGMGSTLVGAPGIGCVDTGSLIVDPLVVASNLPSAPYAVPPPMLQNTASAPQATAPVPYEALSYCQPSIIPSPVSHVTESGPEHCWNSSQSQESAGVLCEDEVVDWQGMEQGEDEDAEGYTSFLALDCQPLATPVLPMLDSAVPPSFAVAPSFAMCNVKPIGEGSWGSAPEGLQGY
ncbi:hypothetical protein CLOM_g11779 [Closterium sp. NIES-68]|nr:hypothetical protein CLOM_g11779 [Closterium sp. NIES-68]GJP82131.1 hypothetical protein CLOP_g12348 [Closterium sp. NIES-67]